MSEKFNERFNIDVGIAEARRRFVNRVHNQILNHFLFGNRFDESDRSRLEREVVSDLGERYRVRGLSESIGDDFHRNLQALESLHLSMTDACATQLDALVTSDRCHVGG